MKYLFTLLILILPQISFSQGDDLFKFQDVFEEDVLRLKSRSPELFQRPIRYPYLDTIVRDLMATENYAGVEIYSENNRFIVIGQALRSIGELRITGNTQISSSQILEASNLAEGQRLAQGQMLEAKSEVEKLLIESGFLNSRVMIQSKNMRRGQVSIEIQVVEGLRSIIDRVQVRTDNPRLLRQISSTLRRFEGQVLSDTQIFEIRQTIINFLNRNRYLTSRLSEPSIEMSPDQSKAELIYAIERAEQYEFYFLGNNFFSQQYLIRRFQLSGQSSVTSSPASDFANRIKDTYLMRGFAHVEVKYQESVDSENFKHRIDFQITEGPRVRISGYNISGKYTRPPSYYQSLLRANSSDLVRTGYFSSADLRMGADGVIVDLQNQGFLGAQILSIRPIYGKRAEFANVDVLLDEGPQTFVQSIEIQGNQAFSTPVLSEVLQVEVSRPLSLLDLEESLVRLEEFYTSQGYLEFQILNEDDDLIRYSDNNTLAHLKIQINEGPQLEVRSIQAEGNTFTKDYVVINELEFETGDILTPEKIEDSLFRLQRLGIFSRIDIDTAERGTPVAERTVLVQVGERDPGTFSMGLGLTNQYDLTYRGFLGLNYRNLFGTGRSISGRMDVQYSQDPEIQYPENRINFSYLEPYVLTKRTKARFILERSEEVFQPTVPVRIQEKLESRTFFEHEFSRRVKFIWNAYTFSNLKTFGRRAPRDESTLNIGSVGPLLELDFRDNFVNPTRGTLSRFDVEYSDPILGSSDEDDVSIKYIRTTGSITSYLPLRGPRLVWANSVRGGYLKNLSPKDFGGVPAVKMFFLGGQNSLRGFDAKNERFPQPSELGEEDLSQYFLPTETHFYLIKSEFRFPIVGNFGMALFYDGGAVHILGQTFKGEYRDSVGLGLRYLTPVGAVAIEVGRKLDPQPDRNEGDFAIHLSIGSF